MQEYVNTVRESIEKQLEEDKNNKTVRRDDVEINEAKVINQHEKQVAKLHLAIEKIKRDITNAKTPQEQINLINQKEKLQKEYDTLLSYTKSDIIFFAKEKKAAYLNAKNRYRKLSTLEKLRIKMNGQELTWSKIEDDPTYTTSTLDMMYRENEQGRSK